MAEEETTDQENEEEGKEGKKKIDPAKVKLIAFILVVVLLIGASIGGTLYFLGVFEGGDEAEEVVETEQVEDEGSEAGVPAKAPAMYFPIKPSFVVNFTSRGRTRFLQVDVTVLTRDQAVFDAIQQHLPLVKNQLIMLFSGEVYEDLQTDEGRELLRQKSMEVLQAPSPRKRVRKMVLKKSCLLIL